MRVDLIPPRERWRRRTRSAARSLPTLAFASSLAFVLVSVVEPYSDAYAATGTTMAAVRPLAPGQSVLVDDGPGTLAARDAYSVTAPPPPPPPVTAAASPVRAKAGVAAPPAGKPDPGTAQAIAYQMLQERGWGDDQFSCLVSLWNRESHWNVYAANKSSGAYGIPQALPGSKMASAGPNWQSDAATQITWGLGYITSQYGTPCGAWSHSQATGWY